MTTANLQKLVANGTQLLDDKQAAAFLSVSAGSTGQLHAIGEASLDLGEVVALLFAHFANDRVHVFTPD